MARAAVSKTAGRGFESSRSCQEFTGGDGMEVKYEPQGPEGKQCKDCQHFQADAANAPAGKCFGKDVLAAGTCNMFASMLENTGRGGGIGRHAILRGW